MKYCTKCGSKSQQDSKSCCDCGNPFEENEKSNLTKKELFAFKELSKILLGLSRKKLAIALENGDLMEVGS